MDWWDQDRVASARVLVVGAGALGNEILKNCALMGVGRVLVYDMDRIEESNLSRGVLFRQEDEGCLKAETVVRRMRDLNPDVQAMAKADNIIHGAGLGMFLWADVVLGAVDNREARIFVNSACSLTGRTWVDGAIEGLSGVVRVFDPGTGPCYECTMNDTDRKLVAERRSCALLARDARDQGHVANTAVAASVIGALEVQEALKVLHDRPALDGEGLHLEGLWNEVSRVKYPRRADCPGHERLGPVVALDRGVADVSLGELLDRAEAALGDDSGGSSSGEVTLDFSRDVVLALTCPGCGTREPVGAVLGSVGEKRARCTGCGTHRILDFASSASRDGKVDLSLTPADLGLPPLDVITARRGLKAQQAWLFNGDAARVLGPLADSLRESL